MFIIQEYMLITILIISGPIITAYHMHIINITDIALVLLPLSIEIKQFITAKFLTENMNHTDEEELITKEDLIVMCAMGIMKCNLIEVRQDHKKVQDNPEEMIQHNPEKMIQHNPVEKVLHNLAEKVQRNLVEKVQINTMIPVTIRIIKTKLLQRAITKVNLLPDSMQVQEMEALTKINPLIKIAVIPEELEEEHRVDIRAAIPTEVKEEDN